jgi:hypothetical protein
MKMGACFIWRRSKIARQLLDLREKFRKETRRSWTQVSNLSGLIPQSQKKSLANFCQIVNHRSVACLLSVSPRILRLQNVTYILSNIAGSSTVSEEPFIYSLLKLAKSQQAESGQRDLVL